MAVAVATILVWPAGRNAIPINAVGAPVTGRLAWRNAGLCLAHSITTVLAAGTSSYTLPVHALRAATAWRVAATAWVILTVSVAAILAWAARGLAAPLVTVGTFVARGFAVTRLRLTNPITTVFAL